MGNVIEFPVFDFGVESLKETNTWRLKHGMDPLCPTPDCDGFGRECETYVDEFPLTQNYPNRERYLATKCCDAIVEVNPMPQWDLP